jgi:hypothetical protein
MKKTFSEDDVTTINRRRKLDVVEYAELNMNNLAIFSLRSVVILIFLINNLLFIFFSVYSLSFSSTGTGSI